MTFIPREEYLKSLPRKRAGGMAIFFNDRNELLIVKPNYSQYWQVPGGNAETNESPLECCKREIKEEIGLDIQTLRFLGVNYEIKKSENDEVHIFVFFGGILNERQISQIIIQKEELDEFTFLPEDQVYPLVSKPMKSKLQNALKAYKEHTVFYNDFNRDNPLD